MLKKTLFVAIIAILPALDISAWSQAAADFSVERNVAMKTRDGVTLYADIYRPAGEGTFPVLLQRTPYNRQNARGLRAHGCGARASWWWFRTCADATNPRASGIRSSMRPTTAIDTVEWAAALPHANGKVGMFGGSYVGATQMLAAVGHPPHLAGICPVVTASNYHENWTYQGGAFEQWFNESWTSGLAQDTFNRAVRGRDQCHGRQHGVAAEAISAIQHAIEFRSG